MDVKIERKKNRMMNAKHETRDGQQFISNDEEGEEGKIDGKIKKILMQISK